MGEKSRHIKLSPEKREELKKKALENRASLAPVYQLGYYVGENIVLRFLPTLSVDMLQTRKVISVSSEDEAECKKINDVWFNKRMSLRGTDDEKSKASEEEWTAVRAYHEMLEEKYLPKTIECHFQLLNITEENMKEFKEGLGVSLWDCDCSHYSTKPENISVKADEDGWFTIITLKRE